MISLLQKEISDFLSSLIGYLVIAVFLCAVGLFMWVFPIDINVLNSGYANLDALFSLAPWVFLFLCPAITMRLFAEEQRNGTIEWLMTKPLGDWEIILAKFLAGWILTLIAILPTATYYYSVYQLGSPVGNIDSGSIFGSYIGLMLLSGCYVAIGLFASSLTNNQIIAFITAVFLCFVMFIGFDSLSGLLPMGAVEHVFIQFGINEHYLSISRGVVDTRDLLYFFGLIASFLLFTKTKLESREW
ncbi:MAG: gliding motility-associated ABC transporter permease subunit GldF [Cryomorphaceae bacterium]